MSTEVALESFWRECWGNTLMTQKELDDANAPWKQLAFLHSRAELAKALGMSLKTLAALMAKPRAPRYQRGMGFDVLEFKRFVAGRAS